MTRDELREVREAIEAGRRAQEALEAASDALESASRWGILDIFTNGWLVSLAKHTRIGKAKVALAEAQAYLRAFVRELSDVRGIDELRVDVGPVLGAVDILLDNPIVDVFVQAKISDSQERVDAALVATRTVLARLEALR